jgi:MFS family permease
VAYFAVLGVANGVWLSRIPAVKQNLHLTDGVLGLALLAAPAGLVAVVPLAGRIVHRAGSLRPTLIAGICVTLILPTLGLAGSLPALMAALFGYGLAGGMLDVAMNSQAVLVERRAGRPLMTSFHACYSFGGLAGALIGAGFAWAGIGPAVNFTIMAVPLAAVALLAGRWLLADDAGNGPDLVAVVGPADVVPARPHGGETPASSAGAPAGAAAGPAAGRRARMPVALVLMALLATCSLLGEGAAEGWSAVYLRDNLGTSAGLAAIGYAGFSVAMAFGRLSGDRLGLRFGAVTLMRCCGLVAMIGLATALLSGSPVGAIAGFTIFGAGLSCTFPLLLSAAGNADPARPSYGIARVAGFGYVGLLCGPVLIGGLATALGLQWALAVPALLALALAAGAGAVAPGRRRRGPQPDLLAPQPAARRDQLARLRRTPGALRIGHDPRRM